MEDDRVGESPDDPPREERAGEAKGGKGGVRKQVYLRTVYPLNPGIPHFVDMPSAW